jgi:hypothetical protein
VQFERCRYDLDKVSLVPVLPSSHRCPVGPSSLDSSVCHYCACVTDGHLAGGTGVPPQPEGGYPPFRKLYVPHFVEFNVSNSPPIFWPETTLLLYLATQKANKIGDQGHSFASFVALAFLLEPPCLFFLPIRPSPRRPQSLT